MKTPDFESVTLPSILETLAKQVEALDLEVEVEADFNAIEAAVTRLIP
jgi:hypothetical protein